MVNIEIFPAIRGGAGYLTATGHANQAPAGQDMVCCAITALIDALEANLRSCWDIRVMSQRESGHVRISWIKTDHRGVGINRANIYAGFVENALRELAKAYPTALEVHRKRRE